MIGLSSIASALIRQAAKRALRKAAKTALKKGGRVETVHTDLHMRSDHGTEDLSGYQLSDFRIEYTDSSVELRTLDAEVDVGYSSQLIGLKMSALPGMVWFRDTRGQARKIKEVARSLDQDVRVLVI